MYQPDFLAQVREQLQVQEDPAKLRQPLFETSSGIPLKNSYTPSDIADQDPLQDLGAPGKFPFTRHVQPTGYRGKLWTMRQYAGFATAEESNARYRYLLA
ncbi:MAG: methylmalonyl-CoA mutase, partial [Acidobacteria bacterium]|nr:methylmalonyl-CoA mutase [Acidobacteriota bacterium]